MTKPRHYHLVVAKDPSGQTDDYIALITLGKPGDPNIVVCSCERCKTVDETKIWFDEEMESRPWEREWQ
jgi:hypothetical protein